MSTQHPDNVNVPSWSESEVIDGNTEVFEAVHAFKDLGCQEVMWDAEGKDVDTRVVRKLLSKHWDYFANHVLGENVFLTYRIPNPSIEPVEKKVVVETLQNIAVAFDVASVVYNRDVSPIFEVILPFTTQARELNLLQNYYERGVVGIEETQLLESTTVRDWVGGFKPRTIRVIPLVEDFQGLLAVDRIVGPYLDTVKLKHLRVFIARSDPALNYGLIPAVLLSKIALSKLGKLGRENGTEIHPIIGVGSKPFRGHLSPHNIDNFLQEYRGLSTVTVQSAFRYDYPPGEVQSSISSLNARLPNREPAEIQPHEEEALLRVLHKCRAEFELEVEALAQLVNSISAFIPSRRARKLHTGLFGYSRNVAGVSLPRAIPFATAFYSIGVPPEFIGSKILENLEDEEWDLISKYYLKIKHDLNSVGGYVSWENINMLIEMRGKVAEQAEMSEEKLEAALPRILEGLSAVEERLGIRLGPATPSERKHENYTNNFLVSYIENEPVEARKALVESATMRRCLG
ncbi:MAG TPA: phosphoenolpyruvate carboxylase [Candidatus Dormibacteraeota bacterium]|jgi:phosphoenolpyruvate carboxylase|nr:phosphoenolpyruvate carboxylase [Candidatus Dormibacteraeota bacterium]